jgi:hypothetical protein
MVCRQEQSALMGDDKKYIETAPRSLLGRWWTLAIIGGNSYIIVVDAPARDSRQIAKWKVKSGLLILIIRSFRIRDHSDCLRVSQCALSSKSALEEQARRKEEMLKGTETATQWQ